MRFDSQITDPTFNIRGVKTDPEEFNQSRHALMKDEQLRIQSFTNIFYW